MVKQKSRLPVKEDGLWMNRAQIQGVGTSEIVLRIREAI